jgi:PKD repeat protein
MAGSDAEIKTSYITVTAVPVAPTAAFTSNKQTGTAPLTVTFTGQSTGTPPLSYDWDFNNDRITDSTIKSPSFTYTTAGTYTVNLTVTNSLGSDSELKTGYITVNPTIAPHAAFTSDVQSGDAPLKVKFTDQSTGTTPLTYAWDFNNDGKNDSTNQSPSFTYTAAGTYTVKLTVTNGAGSNVHTEPDYITVNIALPSSHAGVAITFDDDTIDQWYAIRDILNRNNAHVTFFVSNFASLNQDQINKLKTLQADGHEIAFHGYAHVAAAQYLQSHSINEYLDNEIINGVNLMKNEGFNPVDFAYPYGDDDPALTLALQAYFGHIRDTYEGGDDGYYQYGSNQADIAGFQIDDHPNGPSKDAIDYGISIARQEDKILILYGHQPVQTVTGDYMTSYDMLEHILKTVSENNMKFYTVSELT